jgi:GntR family transcriptional regulator
MSDQNHCRDDDDRDAGGFSDNGDDRPLYLRVRDALMQRIETGKWRPGQVIPNEHEIAREFDVSQGTARRALTMLTEIGYLTRRQGAGTWVQEDSPAVRYRFFSFYDKNNERITPESRNVESTIARANSKERQALDLDDKAKVIRITRTRTRDGRPFIAERLSIPEAHFPNLTNEDLPDALYDHYQKQHKVMIVATADKINAVPADAPTAEQLRVKVGTPLLKIDRIAYTLRQKPVEWRVWLCHLKDAHYLARM